MAAVPGQPSPKPGSVKSPVPAVDAQQEADAFLSSFSAPEMPANAASSPADAEANSFMSSLPGGEAAPEAAPTPESSIIGTVGQVLDYPGGIVRTGVAGAVGAAQALATGQPSVVQPKDIMDAIKGKPHSSEEFLKRFGVDEGPHFDIPHVGRVTLRDVEGLGFDIATDPTTAIIKLAKDVPYIKKLINMPGAVSEAFGKMIYDSGLSKVDAKLAERGTDSVSDVLRAEGVTGTSKQISEKARSIANGLGEVRQGLYDKASELGVSIDMGFPFKRAEAVLKKMAENPGLAPQAAALGEILDKYKGAGKVSIAMASDFKTSLYDALPAAAFEQNGRLRTQASKFKAALAGDLRQAIVEAGNTAEHGLGDAVEALNHKWSILIDAAKPLAQQAKGAAAQSKLGLGIDMALLGAGQFGALATKKVAELATTTYAKSKIGMALMNAGQTGLMNKLTWSAAQRAAIQKGRAERNLPAIDPTTADTPETP